MVRGVGREAAWPEVAKGLILSQLLCPSPSSLGAPPSRVLRLPFPASAHCSYLDHSWSSVGAGGGQRDLPFPKPRRNQPSPPTRWWVLELLPTDRWEMKAEKTAGLSKVAQPGLEEQRLRP